MWYSPAMPLIFLASVWISWRLARSLRENCKNLELLLRQAQSAAKKVEAPPV